MRTRRSPKNQDRLWRELGREKKPTPKDVKAIVEQYLKSHGFDGLYHPDPSLECGCFLVDLFPCDSCPVWCIPGKKMMNDDGDWIITGGER